MTLNANIAEIFITLCFDHGPRIIVYLRHISEPRHPYLDRGLGPAGKIIPGVEYLIRLIYHSMIKFLLICPTSALEKIFNPQNILYIPPVKNCFHLEFEQIP